MIIENYFSEITATIIVVLVMLIIRFVARTLIKKFAVRFDIADHRYRLIIKYFDLIFTTLFVMSVIPIWGINFKNIGIVFSSIFAVIGVALFAQWSILSNITAGIIIFFTIPYKIGDKIKIHDKDFYEDPLTIIDIKAFHLILKSDQGELKAYPNNLILQKGVTLLKNQEPIFNELSSEDKNLSDTID